LPFGSPNLLLHQPRDTLNSLFIRLISLVLCVEIHAFFELLMVALSLAKHVMMHFLLLELHDLLLLSSEVVISGRVFLQASAAGGVLLFSEEELFVGCVKLDCFEEGLAVRKVEEIVCAVFRTGG